jgi:hypothetical protein
LGFADCSGGCAAVREPDGAAGRGDPWRRTPMFYFRETISGHCSFSASSYERFQIGGKAEFEDKQRDKSKRNHFPNFFNCNALIYHVSTK